MTDPDRIAGTGSTGSHDGPAPRPRWVSALLVAAVLLLAVVVVLHLTGNGFGPGSHLP